MHRWNYHSRWAFALLLAAVLAPGLASAQGIVFSPNALVFNGQGGAAPPPQIVNVVASNGGSIGFTAQAFSSGNFLTVSPSSGTTPAAITVSANTTLLATGTYGGFVTLTTVNGSFSIPVTISVNSTGAAPALTTDPASLTFNFSSGATVPSTQVINVTTSTFSGLITATPVTSNGATFVSVNPSFVAIAPNAPVALNVSVSPVNLPAGATFAAIAVGPPGTTGAIIPIAVNVASSAALSASPNQLNFAFQLNTATPLAQTLTITSTTGQPLNFIATATTTSCGNWLVVTPVNSSTPATLNVQVNTTGLLAGNCAGQITVAAPGADPLVIGVNLLVTTNPLLLAPAVGPTFNYQFGANTAIAPQSVQIASSGVPLAFTATATPVSGPNFVEITPTIGITPQSLQLTIRPEVLVGLAPSTYVTNVTVASPGAGNPPQTFPVTLTVTNTPVLIPSQTALIFNRQLGQAPPPSQVLELASSGAPLNFAAAATSMDCPGFVVVSPSTGIAGLSPQLSGVVVTVNTANVTTPTTCNGTITLTIPGSSTPPLNVPVTLNVSATPLLTASPGFLAAIAVTGSTTPAQRTISLTSTDIVTSLNFTATAITNPPGLTWLAVTPNTGATPSNLSVTINPTGLAVGTYQGSIQIVSNSPGVLAQNIPVTLTIASATIAAAPATLSFTQQVGGAAPAPQTIQISGLPVNTTISAAGTMLSGTGWLNVSTGAAGVVNVAVNGAQLSAGTYQGVVTVLAPGTTPSPLNIPVTLTVGNPQVLRLSTSTASFNFTAGSGVIPLPQVVQVTSSGVDVPFTATAATSSGGNFLTVTPAGGTTPAGLTIGINPSVLAGLTPGTYNGAVTISSPNVPGGNQVLNVTLTVAPGPTPAIAGVFNAASGQPGAVAPGEILSIFGTNIGPATPRGLALTAAGLVATTLDNTTVTFDGIPAALTLVSAGQINVIVPYEIAGRATTSMVITRNGTPSAAIQLVVTSTAPAIFTQTQTGSGQGAILNQNGSVNTAANPAERGSVIVIYATGEGQLSPPGVTGGVTPSTGTTFPRPVANVSVTIGGLPATIVYAGSAPGFVSGALQVNAIVPQGVSSGPNQVVLTVGSNSSPSVVTVAIQ